MNKVNLYKKKYEALEIFYGWVDQGSEYDVAVEQSIYYNKQTDELDEVILNITIATRFSRCGRSISDKFKNRLESIISKYRTLNTEKYCFTDDEKDILNEEVEEIEGLIQIS